MSNVPLKKRAEALISYGSPCEDNFHPDGPRTTAEARKLGRQRCPNFDRCNNGGLHPHNGFACTMRYAADIAKAVVEEDSTVEKELKGEFGEFFRNLNPPKGFAWTPEHNKPVIYIDKKKALVKIKEFADQLVGGS